MTVKKKLTETISEEQLSTWYSKINVNKDNFTNFYVDLLTKDFEMPMLEINCGAGNILNKLSEKGIICEGINEDICNYVFEKKYRTIFVPYASFCALEDFSDAIKALKNIFSALDSGGRLAIDIYIPWDDLLSKNDKTWKIGGECFDNTTNQEFVFSYYDDFNLADQVRTMHTKYEIFSLGEILSSRYEVVKTRWYSDTEFMLMLDKIGFKNIVIQKIFEKSLSNYSTLFLAEKP